MTQILYAGTEYCKKCGENTEIMYYVQLLEVPV
jgi:hypothetical protein